MISNKNIYHRGPGEQTETAIITAFLLIDGQQKRQFSASFGRFGAEKHNQTTPKRSALLAGCLGMISNKNIHHRGPGEQTETAKITAFLLVDGQQKRQFSASFGRFGAQKHNQTTPKRSALLTGCLGTISDENIHHRGPGEQTETAKIMAFCLLTDSKKGNFQLRSGDSEHRNTTKPHQNDQHC